MHKAKGLEFPVTIVSSLSEYNFPLAPRDPMRKKIILTKMIDFTLLTNF
ncbi:MAG: hypothetical protein V8S94_06805 [Methanobrevibacter smithii]